ECPEGTVLFQQGETLDVIHFVLCGKVAIRFEQPRGATLEPLTVGSGELLGWSPILGGKAMTATARAATDCRLAVLDVDQILALGEREPAFGVAFLRQIAVVLSERLWATRRMLARALNPRPVPAIAPEGSD